MFKDYLLSTISNSESRSFLTNDKGNDKQEILERINPPTLLILVHKLQNSAQTGSAFVPTKPQNFAPIPNLRTSWNKIMIQIERVVISMISYCTKLHLSKCDGS